MLIVSCGLTSNTPTVPCFSPRLPYLRQYDETLCKRESAAFRHHSHNKCMLLRTQSRDRRSQRSVHAARPHDAKTVPSPLTGGWALKYVPNSTAIDRLNNGTYVRPQHMIVRKPSFRLQVGTIHSHNCVRAPSSQGCRTYPFPKSILGSGCFHPHYFHCCYSPLIQSS